MSDHTEITDEMKQIGEILMKRWGFDPVTEREFDNTGDKHDTIEALCLLFPEASNGQIAVITSMAHGECHDNEVEKIRN